MVHIAHIIELELVVMIERNLLSGEMEKSEVTERTTFSDADVPNVCSVLL